MQAVYYGNGGWHAGDSVTFRFGFTTSEQPGMPIMWTIEPPSSSAIGCMGQYMPIAWDANSNATQWLVISIWYSESWANTNGTWDLECDYWSGGSPATKSGSVEIENMTVDSFTVTGDGVTECEPFVVVEPPDQGEMVLVTASVSVDDGDEPLGPSPVQGETALRALGGGAASCWTVEEHDDAPASFGFTTPYFPGLYYKAFSVHDTDGPIGRDSTSYLSRYLAVKSVVKTDFLVGISMRYADLTVSVTTSDAGTNPITAREYVLRRPDGTYDTLWTGGGPTWSNSTAPWSTGVLMWDLAGAYALGMTYKVSGHEHLYHDGEAHWGVPNGCTVEMPAEAVFADECDLLLGSAFASLASHHEGQLGCLPDGATYGRSFYSGLAPLGVRGGLVWCPTKADALASLQEDHIFCWEGHGWDTSLALCTDSITTTDIASIPDGGLSQLRLAWLGSCRGMYQRQASSIGMGIKAKGAQAVFGYL